jgi:hypothetical protein
MLTHIKNDSSPFTTMLSGAAGAAVYFGERVNALAGKHWQAFAGQDYFDSHGIFYSIMVSAPAVFNLFAVLVSGRQCCDLSDCGCGCSSIAATEGARGVLSGVRPHIMCCGARL